MAIPPVTLSALNAMSPTAFVEILGDIFEHAPWIAEAAYRDRPFATVPALHRSMLAALADASAERVVEFLKGHPDLGGPTARPEPLTEASAREQTGAGLDLLGAEAAAHLAEWNALYRKRFGFPFIVCAARHHPASILAELKRRLAGDPADEYQTALDEIAAITALRLTARVLGPA